MFIRWVCSEAQQKSTHDDNSPTRGLNVDDSIRELRFVIHLFVRPKPMLMRTAVEIKWFGLQTEFSHLRLLVRKYCLSIKISLPKYLKITNPVMQWGFSKFPTVYLAFCRITYLLTFGPAVFVRPRKIGFFCKNSTHLINFI